METLNRPNKGAKVFLKPFGPHLAKLAQRDLEALVNDLAVDVGDVRHEPCGLWTSPLCRMSYTMKTGHWGSVMNTSRAPTSSEDEAGTSHRSEPFAGRVHEARSNRHKASCRCRHSATIFAARPPFFQNFTVAHDGQRLSGESLATKLERGAERAGLPAGGGLIRFRDPLPEVRSEFAHNMCRCQLCCHDSWKAP